MRPVAVVADTTHYLPRDVVAASGIHEVSLYVHWQGRQDREADLPDFDAYYEYLRTAADLPTTSQPSVGDFLEVYEPLVADGKDVVSIHISGGMSGTYESARQAKAALEETTGEERVTVIDSATACGGLGMMMLGAAAVARAGGDREAVEARARETRERLKVWFAIDTMEFLRRGGRVGAARAWLGSTLKIKPILTVESEITPIERVRTSRRAFERMVDYLRSRHEDGADGWMVQHIQARDEADELAARGKEIFGTDPLLIGEVGPVIGTHVGPGLLGVGGVPKRLLEA
ncbi:MAG TPA: DegV family protein [Solirubrobacteraceae bacterium]|nr:DegV family protein [Solirubrobacteraceae bacterium]